MVPTECAHLSLKSQCARPSTIKLLCPHSFDKETTKKLQTSTVAMPLQLIVLPHWNLQASVKLNLNNYKPTLSFPKTLEQLLKKSEKENSCFH